MNALNADVVAALAAAIDDFETNPTSAAWCSPAATRCCRRADIGFMKDFSYLHAYRTDFVTTGGWERLKTTRKPVIAAVAGFALGGGCELAMMCDMIFAADTAKFGQPEIRLGTMPGAGGTNACRARWARPKAMDLCLSARMMDAAEAERAGLVARLCPAAQLLEETLKAAQTIAGFSLPVTMMIKNRSIAPLKAA